MKYMKIRIAAWGFISSILFSIVAEGQVKETFESAVRTGISKGIIKKEGYKVTYLAAPAQDTTRIRNYYEDLIKKTGKPYLFLFQTTTAAIPKSNNISNPNTITQPRIQNTDNSPINIENNNAEKSIVPATTTGIAGNVVTSGYWARQRVFGELHYTDKVEEYIFDVPSDVTSIKVEAWSGGGNGFTLMTYTERVAHEVRQDNILSRVNGGGGGGGAYASATIVVKKGDRFFITIPPGGGGKSVQVKLNSNENIFFLNNGADGNEEGLAGNGYGGNSGGSYGVFKNSLYWISGETGVKSLVTNYAYHDAPNGDGLLLPAGLVYQSYDISFGMGGSAAFLSNGGRGAYFSVNGLMQRNVSSNGGFPGGGGGGGDRSTTILASGKGAPGMVIIHY